MMKRLLKHWPFVLAGLLALCCGFCLWRLWAVSHLLQSQRAAERWKGESGRDFAQVSCFMPPDAQLTRDEMYSFRNDMAQKLKAASYDIETEKGLYLDAWSAFTTAKVSAGRQSGEVQVVAVGGNFFAFHPLRLLSGSYFTPGDVMDDRVLLDRETAWLLFGAADVAGMSFSLEGVPFVVAGVYAHETDPFSKRADGGEMRIYMNGSAFDRLESDFANEKSSLKVTAASFRTKVMEKLRKIACYELVMAEPVKGFVYSSVTEKFPIKTALTVENTYRFEASRLWKLARNSMERSMRKGAYYFPYWENAARAAEDRAALWLMAAVVTGAFPGALVLYGLIRSAVRGKRKLENDVLPEAKVKSRELARSWSRRRWERKHPDEY